MTAHDQFMALIRRCAGSQAELAASRTDEYLVRAGGRVFHFGLRPDRRLAVISTMVHLNDADPLGIEPDLIESFNIYHLFHGGYRLCVDPKTLSLYVSVATSLDRLDALGPMTFLEDFAARCASCSRWYGGESRTRLRAGLASAGVELETLA